MTSQKKIFFILATLVVCLVAVVGVVWALTARSTATPEGTDHHPEAHDPLQDDPELAATSAMAGLMTWQPATQHSPQEAAAAIENRLTGQLEQYADAGEPDPVLPDLWDDWAQAGDTVHAVAEVGEGGVSQPGGGEHAVVDVVVDQEIWHPSGETTPYSRFNATVDVELVDGQWKAERYEITDIDY